MKNQQKISETGQSSNLDIILLLEQKQHKTDQFTFQKD